MAFVKKITLCANVDIGPKNPFIALAMLWTLRLGFSGFFLCAVPANSTQPKCRKIEFFDFQIEFFDFPIEFFDFQIKFFDFQIKFFDFQMEFFDFQIVFCFKKIKFFVQVQVFLVFWKIAFYQNYQKIPIKAQSVNYD